MRVFQTLIAFSGNAPPQLAVTRELIERGHEVRVLAHRATRERVKRTGAEFVEFRRSFPHMDITRRETDTLRDWEPRTPVGYVRALLKNALFAFVEDVARDCVELLEDWPAEVVVFDWMLIGAAIAAERAGLPAVTLVHCPYTLPVDGAPPMGLGLRPMPGRVGDLRDRVLVSGVRSVFAAAGRPVINRARVEQGLVPLSAWEDQLLGAQAIYMMTAAELDFASRGRLPANVHYVGPAFEPYTREWESPWPGTNNDPLVLISFSTSYMNQRALVQRVLDAVGGLPVRALLTAGPALEADQLRIPANTRTVAFIPHRTVLPHAALVVTHAGWQTINAALSDGVPLVCVPDGRDQPDNAARVVAAGAGVRVCKKTSPRKLRRVIVQALGDPALKRGAEAMAEALGRSDGAVTVAEALERLGIADAQTTDPPLARMVPLAREYRGRAAESRPRSANDPSDATHGYVGAQVQAWGRFEAEDPDKRFRVLAGSDWRKPVLNPEATTYDRQVEVGETQDQLVAAGVLDPATMTFPHDHIFENWTLATRVVSGKAQYSGAYQWQLLQNPSE